MELPELEQSKNNFPINLNFQNASMEIIIPVFVGLLCSLLLCAVIGVYSGVYKEAEIIEPVIVYAEEKAEDDYPVLSEKEETSDFALKYFRNYEYCDWVIGFFAGVCSNREIAKAILENADKFNIPPALAFALCWEESRFNPHAVSRLNRDGSVDRGLFQLNSRSFPNLEVTVFYDIKINTYYGLAHLRYCLDSGINEVSALAMYNAGTGKVKSSGAPEVTLSYISRILENKRKIESQFHTKLIKEEENRFAEIIITENIPLEKINKESQFYFNRTLISASPL
jgi:hypothetical protein